LEAQRILQAHGCTGKIIDLDFHEKAVQGVAKALRDRLRSSRRITHLGIGQAEVKEVASNRRFLNPDGSPNYGRSSGGGDLTRRQAPEGTIDPMLKTLSFWDGDQPVLALNAYATHPMSYYGTGRVSADFPGIARSRRQSDDPKVHQIYASGASGNVMVGKYNDGTPAMRPIFADRLYRGMVEAWKATQRHALRQVEFRAVPLRLEPRSDPGFTVDDLTAKLKNDDSHVQEKAAMGLSWRKRADAGYKLDLPVVDFGVAQLVLLPAEIYVEYQLLAQKLRPDSFVVVAGYGECAPGYIPIERAWKEHDQNLDGWCWVAPGAEPRITQALTLVLEAPTAE
jgi:hypothetical protein